MNKESALQALKWELEHTKSSTLKDAILALHPELAESEDEKIRRIISLALIASEDELSDFYKVHKIHRKECTDWLEKQKEQNVVPSRETILGIWELGNLWKENPEERNGLTQLQYIQKYWFEKCDYLKEQKPAEVNVKALLAADRLASAEMTGRLKERSEIINNPEKYGLQKPAEMDNEEIELSDFESELFSAFSDGWQQYLHGEEVDVTQWAKEHSAQLLNAAKQELKPAEWSGEDENYLEEIIDDLKFCKKNRRSCVNGLIEDCIDWLNNRLKSIRPQPHWKPSEQEKGALRTAIYILTEERNFPLAAAHLQDILNAFKDKESRKDWKPSEE